MTPAANKGIVLGKTFRVASIDKEGGASAGIRVGTFVQLRQDDGTELPYFWILSEDGELDTLNHNRRGVINITKVKLVPKDEPEVPAELPAVHISLNGNSTTIVIQKRLTPDEMHAVLAEVGL